MWESVLSALTEIGGWDLLGIFLCAFFAILGLIRGFVWQAGRLVALWCAILAAQVLAPLGAVSLQAVLSGVPDQVADGSAYVVVFCGVLFAVSLATRLARKLVRSSPLSMADRVLGLALGLLTGFCIHAVVILVMTAFFSETLGAGLARSHTVAWTRAATEAIAPMATQTLREHLGTVLDALPHGR